MSITQSVQATNPNLDQQNPTHCVSSCFETLNGYQVIKRDGSLEQLMVEKIISCLQRVCHDFGSEVSHELILNEVIKNLFHQIKTQEVLDILILSSSALIEKDPIYSKVAARFLLQKIYKNVLGEVL